VVYTIQLCVSVERRALPCALWHRQSLQLEP